MVCLIVFKHTLKFQHTAARRRLALIIKILIIALRFQHTAARRRLAKEYELVISPDLFQHTAARRRLGLAEPEMLP